MNKPNAVFAVSAVLSALVSAAGYARASGYQRVSASACTASIPMFSGNTTAVYLGGNVGEWENQSTNGSTASIDCPIPDSDAYQHKSIGSVYADVWVSNAGYASAAACVGFIGGGGGACSVYIPSNNFQPGGGHAAIEVGVATTNWPMFNHPNDYPYVDVVLPGQANFYNSALNGVYVAY
jgi:hypothetical protein